LSCSPWPPALGAASARARTEAYAAATCSDYSTQQAAQNAADTRDPDGDGIYCEDLPCPCAGPNGGSTSPQPTAPSRRPKLGASINLAPWTKRTGCRVRGALPDHACTPGARFRYATKSKVCRPGYSSAVRHVSDATKRAVYEAYGMTRRFNGADGEVDHLVSLELGGSNSRANLFPEAATPRPGSHEKDRLENRLHDEVCTGRLRLRRAQRLISTDWVAAYHARFG
jgi:hypothetical protein